MATTKKWYQSTEIQEYGMYILVILLSAVLLIHPISFPLKITDETIEFIAAIENVPDGGIILWDEAYGITGYYTHSQISLYRLFFDQAKERGVKLIFISTCVDGPTRGAMINKQLEIQDTTGLTYGVDYVNLYWQPGFEIALAAIAEDIKTVTNVDAYGTPMSELPLMQNIKTEDIDLFAYSCGVSCDPWMRQWVPLGKPIIMQGGYSLIAQAMGYITSGSIDAYLNGGMGYVEMERVTGYLSMRSMLFEATNIMGPFSILLVILCNVWHVFRRDKKE